MLDVGWSELLLIGVIALIVVGPKDLPIMFRTLGRFTAKARSMAREFQRAMDDAAKASGVGDALKDVKDMTSKKSLGLDALESAASKFEKWNPKVPAPKPVTAAAAAKVAETSASSISAAQPAGPATQALADKVAAERAERLAPKTPAKTDTPRKTEADGLATPVVAKPIRKAIKRTRAAIPEAAENGAAPKNKPRARKSAAE